MKVLLNILLLLNLFESSAQNCMSLFSYGANFETVQFFNQSMTSNAHYYWNFGDGTSSNLENPIHIYPENGEFFVTLYALDTLSNCSDYYELWIEITKNSTELCDPSIENTYFITMIAGVGNAWKIPVIQSDEMDFVDMQKNNTDMQFSTWQEYLLKIACSMYKISPEELGFSVGNAGGGGSMFESGTEARLMYSRDKGLIPLLKAIEFWVTKYLVEPIDEAYEFRFAGYDTDGKEKELELDLKLVNSFVGWKEMRKKWNYPDELEEGDFPLNSAWIQRTGALEMQQQQQESTQAAEQDQSEDDDQGGDDFSWDNMGAGDDEDPWESLDKGHSANPMMNDLLEFWNQL